MQWNYETDLIFSHVAQDKFLRRRIKRIIDQTPDVIEAAVKVYHLIKSTLESRAPVLESPFNLLMLSAWQNIDFMTIAEAFVHGTLNENEEKEVV